MNIEDLVLHGEYNFKNQPERLKYVGKEGAWHQFEKVGGAGVWAEVLDEDLGMLEVTTNATPAKAERMTANSRQLRKNAAAVHNEARERKLALAQDKIDNPEKYLKPKLSRKEQQILAMLAGMGVL